MGMRARSIGPSRSPISCTHARTRRRRRRRHAHACAPARMPDVAGMQLGMWHGANGIADTNTLPTGLPTCAAAPRKHARKECCNAKGCNDDQGNRELHPSCCSSWNGSGPAGALVLHNTHLPAYMLMVVYCRHTAAAAATAAAAPPPTHPPTHLEHLAVASVPREEEALRRRRCWAGSSSGNSDSDSGGRESAAARRS